MYRRLTNNDSRNSPSKRHPKIPPPKPQTRFFPRSRTSLVGLGPNWGDCAPPDSSECAFRWAQRHAPPRYCSPHSGLGGMMAPRQNMCIFFFLQSNPQEPIEIFSEGARWVQGVATPKEPPEIISERLPWESWRYLGTQRSPSEIFPRAPWGTLRHSQPPSCTHSQQPHL